MVVYGTTMKELHGGSKPVVDCPHCTGVLTQQSLEEYTCNECERTIRASVVERIDSFKRVAAGDDKLAEIAAAGLEGQK